LKSIGEVIMAVIKNVVLNYVKIKQPTLEFEKKEDASNPVLNKEFVVDALIQSATYKKLKKIFKTVAAIKTPSHNVTAAEYKEIYKVEVPEGAGWCNDDGEYTIVKFRKKAYYKSNGDATDQPIVRGIKGDRDASGQTVNPEVEVGNGSLANLQFNERNWEFGGKKGLSLDLGGIQVINLVEYTAKNVDEFEYDEDEFGGDDDFGGDADDDAGDDDAGDDDAGDDDAGDGDEPW
jgi:hypothetical protein